MFQTANSDSPGRSHLSGVDITVNIEAQVGADDFPVRAELNVEFVEESNTKVRFMTPLQAPRATLLSNDGRKAIIAMPEHAVERGEAVRWVVPYAAGLQNVTVLHASSVRLETRSILFVGESGAGKSTTARTLASLGGVRLSDDLFPVPDVREELDELVIFFLTRVVGTTVPKFEPLPRAESLRLLMRHGFGDHRDEGMWRCHFRDYERLINAAIIASLYIPDDIDLLLPSMKVLVDRVGEL